MALLRNLR